MYNLPFTSNNLEIYKFQVQFRNLQLTSPKLALFIRIIARFERKMKIIRQQSSGELTHIINIRRNLMLESYFSNFETIKKKVDLRLSLEFPVYLCQENSSVSSAGGSNQNPTLSFTMVLISSEYNKILNKLTRFVFIFNNYCNLRCF